MNSLGNAGKKFRYQLNQPLQPDLNKVHEYLSQVNQNAWFTNFGPLESLFTTRLAEYLGVSNLLLVSSGTAALQVASQVLGVKRLITTPFSFVATSSAMLWQGKSLVYADIDNRSFNLSPRSVENVLQQRAEIDAVLATHVYGNPCDLMAFERLSQRRDIKIIYDAAQSFGVKVEGKSILEFGDASVLSLHATKLFHCVEGGAIVFKNSELLERARAMSNFGITDRIEEVGINAKLSEYHAAVGLSLLDEVDRVVLHRKQLLKYYQQRLSGLVEFPRWHESSESNGAYMPIIVPQDVDSDWLVSKLASKGVQSRRYFKPSLDTVFTECESFNCSNSHYASQSLICLPMHYYLTFSDVDSVTEILSEVLEA